MKCAPVASAILALPFKWEARSGNAKRTLSGNLITCAAVFDLANRAHGKPLAPARPAKQLAATAVGGL